MKKPITPEALKDKFLDCQGCGGDNLHCIDSRLVSIGRRRRYECFDCGLRVSTIEIRRGEYDAMERKAMAVSALTDIIKEGL